MRKTLVAGAALLISAWSLPALAHDEYGNPNEYHWQDHAEHRDIHEDLAEAHRRAHEEGFANPYEHWRYHQRLSEIHRDFHEDHPGTWHDHYPEHRWGWWGWRSLYHYYD